MISSKGFTYIYIYIYIIFFSKKNLLGTWYLKYQVPLVQNNFKELDFVKIEFHLVFLMGNATLAAFTVAKFTRKSTI